MKLQRVEPLGPLGLIRYTSLSVCLVFWCSSFCTCRSRVGCVFNISKPIPNDMHGVHDREHGEMVEVSFRYVLLKLVCCRER